MAVLDIITAPHPILEMKARPVEDDEFGPALATHCSNMAETMYAAPGVGLAAPQVSDPRRILVMDPGEGDERGKRYFALINPVIVEKSTETISWWETCLSVPGLEVEKKRHQRIKVAYRTPDGGHAEEVFEGFEAVIYQHEADHLGGTILLDAVSHFKRQRYLQKAKKVTQRDKAPAR